MYMCVPVGIDSLLVFILCYQEHNDTSQFDSIFAFLLLTTRLVVHLLCVCDLSKLIKPYYKVLCIAACVT